MVSLVAGTAAAIVPSLRCENQPCSILEVWEFGKPVMASALGGVAELV